MNIRRRLLTLLLMLVVMAVILPTAILHAEPPGGWGDVPNDYWARAFINAFYDQGVTAGCGTNGSGQTLYCPESGVTRAEMAVFIGKALGYKTAADAGYVTEAYFKQTGTGTTHHGIIGESIAGIGVY